MTLEEGITMKHTSKSIKIHLHHLALSVAMTLLVFGFTGWTDAEAGTGECLSQVVPMESDGTVAQLSRIRSTTPNSAKTSSIVSTNSVRALSKKCSVTAS